MVSREGWREELASGVHYQALNKTVPNLVKQSTLLTHGCVIRLGYKKESSII